MHHEHGWDGQEVYEGVGGLLGTVHKGKRGWDTGDAPKICSNCDHTPKDKKQMIYVTYEVWKALMAICGVVKVEWQALLKGTIEENGDVRVSGYYIPKQEVGPAFVKNLDVIDDEFIRTNNIVAGIHSHANMSCFFSQTDVDHTNMSLIKHNIVVNNKGEYKAQTRIDLPCAMVKFIDALVYTVGEPDGEIVGLDNIVEKKWGFETTNVPATKPKWNDDKPSNTRYPGYIEEGMRDCPVCMLVPEEDSGICTCWTKNLRPMLPDFTEENYERETIGGRWWTLRSWLKHKYSSK